METKAILFDYDGTIVDSVEEVYKGTCNVLLQSGIAKPTFTEFCENYEAPYSVYYNKMGVTASDADICKWYFSVARSDEQPLFPDVHEVLEELHKQKVLLGIISAHFEDKVSARLEEFGLAQYMQVIVGRAHSKVVPIKKFCLEQDVDFSNTLYVGDLASDVRDAKQAGVVSVGITRGNGTREMLLRNGADYCISNLFQLL